ncbi:Uncharacterized protein BP5553_00340 [Venustampulla echinocandica]|uniref:Uncharacterized protein n=1 Tax=Venustampulla echinocandica TaxID=2656787 RepID=A0A370TXW9_9HELO|nr:Uncharacterized protein BP5553_00340 [Venustampulla echinocandica]RDL40361.1 Uncharacterized protein BP5553_00340 [Venustampulla echinocandica]
MSGSRAITRAATLARRTVHVKMFPTPRTFPERREVLRVMEQLGEVEMFRSLKYHPKAPVPNAFLSMFRTEAAAVAALNQSPIRYRLMPNDSQSEDPSTETLLGSTLTPPDHAPAEPSTAKPNDEKIFELHISTTTIDHERYLRSPSTNPLYGPFIPISPVKSYIAASLDAVISPSMWAPGLKDWETDGSQLGGGKVADLESEPGQSMPVTSIEWRVNRRQTRRREKLIPKVMMGLKNLRQEWEAEQELKLGKPVKSAAS